ncbi:MAG: Acyl-CoA:1-acyl-sn-glycerol-3-phosphate acyltransferase, partial [uncultured Nocardioidaceae bacterium]
VLLVLALDRPGSGAAGAVPPGGRGARARARAGAGHPRQQPPVVHRLGVHAAHAAPQGDVRGQGRVLHDPGPQGLAAGTVLPQRRPGPHRPQQRGRRRGCVAGGQEGAVLGGAVRDLPRGDPVPRRAPLPRPDRGRPAGDRDRGAGGAGRGARHRHRRPPGQEVRAVGAAAGALRPAAGLLPLRGARERPLRAPVGDRRDHVRDHAALRSGVRRRLRLAGQGAGQGSALGWRPSGSL